ncbi:tRNA pseudouridine(55) synthase TruB [Brevibacterium sp. HMSC063G07]|uniref:tRNA pseudouridine(55) synthase TruB n=1 Tax=Brevibacterium sp. HMSC063G07 TaxID=1739261 RepID=UPI0008A4752A|nr:tRNA pseudouridine(55) synthase TruB [Brevibacterium sp. HMSC063G07]OFL64837.1 tRNA pseudouridine(55) synthase [Brevibacterium sp. HMSC063G07]
MTKPASGPTGLLLIDKPGGITSHDAVARTRRWYGTRKVGHAGTLDPMATGLLVLGLGQGTKLLTYVVGADKTYTATVRLGSSTPSDDADSSPDRFADPAVLAAVTEADVKEAVARQTGSVQQVPSAVSAVKIAGRKAYELVRAGEDVELKARSVTVSRFDIHDVRRSESHIDVDVSVDCSTGTYVRALARDIGEDLGVYGHLTALRRTRIGPFSVEDAHRLPDRDRVDEVPPPQLLDLGSGASALMPAVTMDAAAARGLLQGRFLPIAGADSSVERCAAIADGRLVGIVEPRQGLWKIAVGTASLDEYKR